MVQWTAAEIARIVDGRLQAEPTTLVVDVSTDTRALTPGCLFVAIPGEQFDGADYAAAAIAGGAALVLAQREVGVASVIVEDVLTALAALARAHVDSLPDLRVIGVTGSSGKTSTKDLLAQVLASAAPTVAPYGSFNNDIGLPMTVLQATPDTRFLVLEMGMRGIGQIERLCRIAPPDVAVVLNVGTAHVGELGGRDAIARGKGEIYAALQPDGVAIINRDDGYAASFIGSTNSRIRTFGVDDGDVHADDIRLDELARGAFTLCIDGERAEVHLQLLGEHHIANALAAAAIADACGMSAKAIAHALSEATATSKWRMEITELPNGVTLINDAYNANPESMRSALKALAVMGRTRRTWAILGEMRELGDTAVEEHDAIGRLAVRLDISHVVCIGPMGKIMQVAAMNEGSWGDEAVHVVDREAAVEYVRSRWLPGDIVLVKASRSIGLERVAEALAAAAAGQD